MIKDIEGDVSDKNIEIDGTDYEDLFGDIANVRNDIEDMYIREIEKNSSL